MANVPFVATKSSTATTFSANDASSGVVTAGAVETARINPLRLLSANVALSIKTLNLAIRGKWQGSVDNSTWVDYVPENVAANVTIQSGTGTRTVSVCAPAAVMSKRWVRYGLYIEGGATGTSLDTVTASYSLANQRHVVE